MIAVAYAGRSLLLAADTWDRHDHSMESVFARGLQVSLDRDGYPVSANEVPVLPAMEKWTGPWWRFAPPVPVGDIDESIIRRWDDGWPWPKSIDTLEPPTGRPWDPADIEHDRPTGPPRYWGPIPPPRRR